MSTGDVDPLFHFCRGCGLALPLGSRRMFHKDCLKVDKLRRVRGQRQKELKRFLLWVQKQTCPYCGLILRLFGGATENKSPV